MQSLQLVREGTAFHLHLTSYLFCWHCVPPRLPPTPPETMFTGRGLCEWTRIRMCVCWRILTLQKATLLRRKNKTTRKLPWGLIGFFFELPVLINQCYLRLTQYYSSIIISNFEARLIRGKKKPDQHGVGGLYYSYPFISFFNSITGEKIHTSNSNSFGTGLGMKDNLILCASLYYVI